jgi:acetyl-CoA carboxylase, biotin carboxylase subunit
MTLRRILIANRGEIAVRVIGTCQRLGIETVLAASEADVNSMAARLADSTVCLGAGNSAASYLNVDAVIGAAVASKAEAIHPGYGFLSENQKLAEACTRAGLCFIGPTVAQLDTVGDKLKARKHAAAAGLAVVPGGEVVSLGEAQRLADQVGWPILIKAVGGGGGRGLKQVHDASSVASAMEMAATEAQASFGDPRLYIERFISHGRHIEVQVLGDGEDVIHLGTRDCSIQRRYQKLVEEAPAPNVTEALRSEMHRAAIGFARLLKYTGLGTVEFLVDCDRNAFYFLEMNARIQVEHPVTEVICGLDLVEEQIAVAERRKLRWKQDEIKFSGHAIECRINAEEWTQNFRPDPGTVTRAIFPVGQGIRVDTHIQSGASIPHYYDSLLGKLIVHGADRWEALRRLRRAISSVAVSGVATNLSMYLELLRTDEFARGSVNTVFLEDFLERRRVEAA